MNRWVSRPIAAKLLGVTLARLDELAEQGALRRYGGTHATFNRADLEHLAGRTFDEFDFAYAVDGHQSRLDAYKRANAKRRASEPFNGLDALGTR
jgi:hypothetical protein